MLPMSKHARILLWVGAVLAPFALFYALLSAVFYAWMNANGSWPAERAATWVLSCLVLAVAFLVLFVWCVWKLIRSRKLSTA